MDTAFADVFAGKSERKDCENSRFGDALGDAECKIVGGGIGIRSKPETAAFIRKIHGGREKRFSERQGCLIIERQSHRGKTRRNQLFERCSEIDEFSGMNQIQNLFQLRMVCAMADSRIKSDTGADAKGSLVFSGGHTSDLDWEYAVWIKNLVQSLYRISLQIKTADKVVAGTGRDTAKGDILIGRKPADDLIECTISADCDQSKGLMDFRKRGGNLFCLSFVAK